MKTDKDIDELLVDDAISETLIRGLRAEVAKLRNDLTTQLDLHDKAVDDNAKLRAALQEIVITDPPATSMDWFAEWKNLVFRLKGIARRALERSQ